MKKSRSSKDKLTYKIVAKELERFKRLVKGHEKLLAAIGAL